MKSHYATFCLPQSVVCFASTALLCLSSLPLSACEKKSEPTVDKQILAKTQSGPVTSYKNTDEADKKNDQMATTAKQNLAPSSTKDIIETDDTMPDVKAATPHPTIEAKSTQITDVTYRSAANDTMTVVFETSATGVLNAIVTLPNHRKMTLSAPEGQGNNPTYRSSDGNMELVSHGGGSTIDVVKKGKVTSFEAISADAAVVTKT